MKGTAVWDLPDIQSSQPALQGARAHRQRLAALERSGPASTGAPYTVELQLPERRRQREPDRVARLRRRASASSAIPARAAAAIPYRQFNTAAFQGPLVGSVGLESGNDYLNGCFSSVLDLSIARNIRLGGGRMLQLRADMFNAPNTAQITGRQHDARR